MRRRPALRPRPRRGGPAGDREGRRRGAVVGVEVVSMGMICRIREVLEGDLDRLAGPREQARDLFRCDHLSGPVLSLEKAWHGLHYLLTGSPWKGAEPLCFLVRG